MAGNENQELFGTLASHDAKRKPTPEVAPSSWRNWAAARHQWFRAATKRAASFRTVAFVPCENESSAAIPAKRWHVTVNQPPSSNQPGGDVDREGQHRAVEKESEDAMNERHPPHRRRRKLNIGRLTRDADHV